MLDFFTANINGMDIPAMTMERAVDRCRKMACDLGRTVILKAKIGNKYTMLGTYEPMPVELMNLKSIACNYGDIYACLAHPSLPKKSAKPVICYDE